MKFALTLTAATVIAFSSFASAEHELSMTEMDIVSAGGSAAADAMADALGMTTSTSTTTHTIVESLGAVQGQLGAIHEIMSQAISAASSNSDGKAVAGAQGASVTVGSLLSETTTNAKTETDSVASLPYSRAWHDTTGIAQTILKGFNTSSSGISASTAILSN